MSDLTHSVLSHFTNNHHSVSAFCTSFFFLGLLPPSSSSSELLFFAELGSLGRPDEPMLDLLPPLLGVELELLFFLYVFMNSAMSSGQSRFFSGSHVLCLLWKSTKQHISTNRFLTFSNYKNNRWYIYHFACNSERISVLLNNSTRMQSLLITLIFKHWGEIWIPMVLMLHINGWPLTPSILST